MPRKSFEHNNMKNGYSPINLVIESRKSNIELSLASEFEYQISNIKLTSQFENRILNLNIEYQTNFSI